MQDATRDVSGKFRLHLLQHMVQRLNMRALAIFANDNRIALADAVPLPQFGRERGPSQRIHLEAVDPLLPLDGDDARVKL